MIDDIDRLLLAALAADARAPLKDLAEAIGLSPPATSERLARLRERGVIRAFTIDIDPLALGFTLQAIVRVRPMPGALAQVQQRIEDMPEALECDKVTGDDCFVLRLALRDIGHLDQALDRLADCAQTSSSIVKAQPLRRRVPPLKLET
ncbi:Lrp/AsnC family transcriptional regulator [Pelomonas sp. Root1237]|uniref:Lrp/AsnC family transcriptional regulator n=1 Tax=Pelomonas sp. Root1237 TaxID=1736434 RepID=UPI0006FDD3BF|nr:Lrp/AsnC family transcriptional regulator [Pelomonas sp. Root1237]KQV86935.1 AsnC family transcriptional regulator [Pelomonas sp. Root1237]